MGDNMGCNLEKAGRGRTKSGTDKGIYTFIKAQTCILLAMNSVEPPGFRTTLFDIKKYEDKGSPFP